MAMSNNQRVILSAWPMVDTLHNPPHHVFSWIVLFQSFPYTSPSWKKYPRSTQFLSSLLADALFLAVKTRKTPGFHIKNSWSSDVNISIKSCFFDPLSIYGYDQYKYTISKHVDEISMSHKYHIHSMNIQNTYVHYFQLFSKLIKSC